MPPFTMRLRRLRVDQPGIGGIFDKIAHADVCRMDSDEKILICRRPQEQRVKYLPLHLDVECLPPCPHQDFHRVPATKLDYRLDLINAITRNSNGERSLNEATSDHYGSRQASQFCGETRRA